MDSAARADDVGRSSVTTGSARAASRLSWAALAAGAALLLAATVALAMAGPMAGTAMAKARASAKAKASASCHKAAGPFSVSGTRVLGRRGKVFIPYGMTVPDLVSSNWVSYIKLDREKIAATADDWCANTIRLQLSQDNLIGPNGTSFNRHYMAEIESEVSLAERYHLVVVLNDSTLTSPPRVQRYQEAPTPATETFWKYLTSVYGTDPQVIFDLFNEPRNYSSSMSQQQEWRLWLNGGWYQGAFYSIGMAKLAEYIRNTRGARNLFWVEGPNYSVSFDGMVRHHALLHVRGVVYAVHHTLGPEDTAGWDSDFGYLVETGAAPVVEGEFTNYEPKPTSPNAAPPRNSCWPDAPTAVPEFFRYLSARGIGLIGYQLQPGYLIKSYSNLADPTTINASTWTCVSNAEPQPGQGAGALLMAWFRQRNR
jgi:Cellulase (glycosyl hydrolase family 5)